MTPDAKAKSMKTQPQKPGEPSPQQEDLSEVIRRIGAGFDALKRSGLNRQAIVVLLHDQTKVGKRQIESVLSGLSVLAKNYTTPKG